MAEQVVWVTREPQAFLCDGQLSKVIARLRQLAGQVDHSTEPGDAQPDQDGKEHARPTLPAPGQTEPDGRQAAGGEQDLERHAPKW